MFIHFFLTSLPPVDLLAPPPLSSDDFLERAATCLSEPVLDDLARLALVRSINPLSQRGDVGLLAELADGLDLEVEEALTNNPAAVRQLYWRWLKECSSSTLVQRFADQAATFFATLASVLARRDGASSETIDGDMAHRDVVTKLEHALDDADPMQLELVIARQLIALMEEDASGDTFATDQIFVYFITLLQCERNARFNQTTGQAMVDAVIHKLWAGAS